MNTSITTRTMTNGFVNTASTELVQLDCQTLVEMIDPQSETVYIDAVHRLQVNSVFKFEGQWLNVGGLVDIEQGFSTCSSCGCPLGHTSQDPDTCNDADCQ
jgi:hypothetical protein